MTKQPATAEQPVDRSVEGLVLDRLRPEVVHVTAPGELRQSALEAVDLAAAAFARRQPHNLVCVYLPLALASTEEASPDQIGVAAACTALYLGARFLDDVIDGHDPILMHSPSTPAATIIGAAFLSPITFSIINRLDADAETRASLTECFATGLARLGDGQLGDIATVDRLAPPDEVRKAIEGKTGWLFAMFAKAALLLSGSDSDRLIHAESFGLACGTGRQILSDCQRLVNGDQRTISRRPCLYPVALHAAQLDDSERERFSELYQRYGTDDHVRAAVLDEAAASGALAKAMVEVELLRAQAEAALLKLIPGTTPSRIIMKMVGAGTI